MIDPSTDKGRAILAALRLAAERPWADVSIRDIAEEAGLSLDAMRKAFGSKTQIISAYMRAIDDQVLSAIPPRDPNETARDALFEVLMARLDAMAEHKPALRSINADTSFDSGLFGSYLNSQRWMLLAAGLDGDGPRGVMRASGLAALFGSVFQVWLDDDDPGLAKTMAALDRRLRRAEATMSSIDQACDGVSRMRRSVRQGLNDLFGRMREGRRPGQGRDDGAPMAGDEPSPPQPDGPTGAPSPSI